MTQRSHRAVLALTAALSACTSVDGGQSPDATLETIRAIGAAHGGDRMDEVAAIRFTFHAQRGPMRLQRRWIYFPQSNRVEFADPKAPDVAHVHTTGKHQVTPRDREVDAWFVNDSFWLLFPQYLATHEFAAFGTKSVHGTATDTYQVYYPAAGGYTPGDRYDFVVDEQLRLTRWEYYPARGEVQDLSAKPALVCDWSDYCQLGPLQLALDHVGPGDFRVWFSDVALLRRGETEWLEPTPLR